MNRFIRKFFRILLYTVGFVILLVFIIGRTEKFKFRYNPEEMLQRLAKAGQSEAFVARDSSRKGGLFYLQIGEDRTKPNLVLIHGSPGSLSAYQPYFTDSILLERYNIVAIDRQGFGYSQFGEAEPSMQKQAAGIASVMRGLSSHQNILVGHSLGGPVIARAAMDFPDLVNGVVMIAPSISPHHEPSNWWRIIVDFPLWRWVIPPVLTACNQEIMYLKEELELMMDGWAEMHMPVTVIQGTADQLVPMENALFAEDMMPQNLDLKVLMLESQDHFILWSKVDLIRAELLEILEKV